MPIWSVHSQKIARTVATGSHTLKLQCKKFIFRWRSASDPLRKLTNATTLPILTGFEKKQKKKMTRERKKKERGKRKRKREEKRA